MIQAPSKHSPESFVSALRIGFKVETERMQTAPWEGRLDRPGGLIYLEAETLSKHPADVI
jgi:hypothetical protein